MKPVEMKKGIYWVGAIDWDLRNFHGYLTQRGSTYNSYLIIDEKVTLIDNVKKAYFDQQLKRISAIIDPAEIDVIIQNHVEMDHSGSLPEIAKYAVNAEIYCSPKGKTGLEKHYKNANLKLNEVNSGETINIGKRNLAFVLTPMVHLPDNMITYCPEEKILFSNDAFGQHIASSERFTHDYPVNITMEEAKKYYANIVLPYGRMVLKVLEQAAELDVEMIAPSHGLIWTDHIAEIISEYQKWASNKTDEEALIIYDSMWGSTKQMACKIMEAFEDKNINTKLINLQNNHISDIMTEVITARYICVGSPTLNNNMLPTVAAFLCYMKGLAPKGRKGLAFGSYGWGGQSIGLINNELKDAGFDVMDMQRINYIPEESALEDLKKIISEQIQ